MLLVVIIALAFFCVYRGFYIIGYCYCGCEIFELVQMMRNLVLIKSEGWRLAEIITEEVCGAVPWLSSKFSYGCPSSRHYQKIWTMSCVSVLVVVYHQSLPVDVKQIPHIQPASLPVFLFAISAQLFVAFLQGLKKNHQVAKLCEYLMAMSNLQDSLRSYLYSYMEQGHVRFIHS